MQRPNGNMSPKCGKSAYLKGFTRFACCLVASTFLASCGPSSPSGPGGRSESSVSYDTLQPLTVPPAAGQGPAAPGTTGARKTADGLPMLDSKGVNTHLFSEKLSGNDARLNRLENAVQEIRNDFDAMAPAIVRLVAIEKDIQNLITQLEVLTGAAPAPAPVAAQPVPLVENANDEEFPLAETSSEASMEPIPLADIPADAVAPEVVAPVSAPAVSTVAATTAAAPATVSGPAVTDVRIGEHPGKTRLVLDVKGKTTFKTNLDNGEKILLIELSNVAWNAAMEKNFAGAPLIASYRANVEGAGMVLVLQLKSSAKIVSSSSLDDKAAKSQRIVIDLSAL